MKLYQRWKRDKYYMLSGLPCQESKFKKEFPGFGVNMSTHYKFLFFCGLTSSLLFPLSEKNVKGDKTLLKTQSKGQRQIYKVLSTFKVFKPKLLI